MASSFGPSALATPANAVTIGRLLFAPPLWLLVVTVGPSYVTLVLWIVLAATDGLDGYLARRHGTTRSGAFLDPLADKALVLGAMWAIVAIDEFWWVPVGLITVRDLLGLFADQEIRMIEGPLFVGEDYLIRREITALSESRRTESYWVRTRIFDRAGKKQLAEMLLNHAILKDSYANYDQLRAKREA